MPHSPDTTRSFTDAQAALAYATKIYQDQCTRLRNQFQDFLHHPESPDQPPEPVRACYPFVRINTLRSQPERHGTLTYGFVAHAGSFETTLTQPVLYGKYYREQFRLLLNNHGVPLHVGLSHEPIALPFCFDEEESFESQMTDWQRSALTDVFDLPDLHAMDDAIANGTHVPAPGRPAPLSLFTAPRVDYSVYRLRHYTGTSCEHFQNFVLFTNYGFYVDEFIEFARTQMGNAGSSYTAFVEPGNRTMLRTGATPAGSHPAGAPPDRMPQMPAYHLKRPDRSGITLINIGVGPSNAKTITDHVAVLRPHAWLLVGHCAGLRNSQRLGDYVLAHAYVRNDHVLDEDLPLAVPLPALAEIQIALQQAVAEVTQLQGNALKRVLRTGTVATTDNRNWELRGGSRTERRLSQSRAIALDMESATIAANGFRFRVPYGTLLCVSDKPLHGDIKLPGMASHFYRQRVAQHLQIGIRALEHVRENGLDELHSRKLRSFAEVAFQ
ncbi:MAG: AMP nucleosidase [Ottowia sp.]|nr:AMP nucleosidase [Ottowia sp.]